MKLRGIESFRGENLLGKCLMKMRERFEDRVVLDDANKRA